jgi:hypothetical protein
MAYSNTEILIVSLASVLYDFVPLCIPQGVVYVGGMVVALRRRRQHPRVARLALLGLGGLFLTQLVFFGLGIFCACYLRTAGTTELNLGSSALQALAFLEQVVKAGALALLILAVFTERSPAHRGSSQ